MPARLLKTTWQNHDQLVDQFRAELRREREERVRARCGIWQCPPGNDAPEGSLFFNVAASRRFGDKLRLMHAEPMDSGILEPADLNDLGRAQWTQVNDWSD